MSRKSLQRIAAIAIGIAWPFRKKNRLLLVGVIAALSAACGDDGPKMPTAPTVVEPPSATEPTITSVSVMGDTVLMGVGETVRLSLVATLSDGSTRDIDPTLAEWRSSDPAVATVASDGVVTAIRAGQATISATYEQQEAELEMSVRISSHSQGSVRVMYVAPADREFRADYSAGIARAIVDVQSWYRNQLDGLTFAIYSVVPEWCQLPRDHDYYSHGDAWEKVLRDVQSCAPVRGDTSRFSWALYVDVSEACGEPHELGRGGAGLTMVPHWDLEGLVNPGEYYYCDEGPYDGPLGRWFGGLAHELGHTFGLPHPPGCDEGQAACDRAALMGDGYASYPNTYLRDDEKSVLRRSSFFGTN